MIRPSRLLLALLLLCSAESLRGQGRGASATPTLAPGDLLRINVWRRPEFSGDFVIADDGSITHPLMRELKVAGQPLSVVEGQVRTFLARFETSPAFVLSPLFRVFVGGEVRAPAVYSVPPGTTVGEAVAQAGGPTERGRLDRVKLVGAAGVSWADLNSPVTTQPEVFSGDQVLVSRSRNAWRDVFAPTASVVGAIAAIVNIVVQLR